MIIEIQMKQLENKVAIVTGGTRGIGRAIVEKFAAEGAKIILTGTSHISDELSQKLDEMGAEYQFVKANAASMEDAEAVVKTCIDKFGRIDILVNNAGITRDTLLMRMSESDWDDVIATNLKSVFNYTRAVQQLMLRQRSGAIVNMSSIAGVMGNAGQTNYAASKAGIIGFTKSIAREIGSRKVRCNAIAPGLIETDMTKDLPDEIKEGMLRGVPLRRMGKAEEIANVALFLVSDQSSYVTGQVIVCDGGM